MKTNKELSVLKMEVDILYSKLAELTADEFLWVTGGAMIVNYNMAAINTLTQLCKNQSSLDQS